MGGDFAPSEVVAGALRAAAEGIAVLLVGDPQAISDSCAALGHTGLPDGAEVVPAVGAVAMDEDPAIALRGKPQASVRVGVELVASGRAAAFVSAGSTGATLAAALLGLGRLPGVRRPVVAAVLPFGRSGVVLVDAGGSPDAQPEALVAYSRMGACYASALGVPVPRVGLLNVGAEAGKGNALAKTAHDLLRDRSDAGMTFVGNVEPQAVHDGVIDVVVTDGFTGNVFLKTVEAFGDRGGSLRDPAGAAVLLGVPGEVLVAHGAARADDVAAAVRTAARVASAGLSRAIAERLLATSTPGATTGGGG